MNETAILSSLLSNLVPADFERAFALLRRGCGDDGGYAIREFAKAPLILPLYSIRTDDGVDEAEECVRGSTSRGIGLSYGTIRLISES